MILKKYIFRFVHNVYDACVMMRIWYIVYFAKVQSVQKVNILFIYSTYARHYE